MTAVDTDEDLDRLVDEYMQVTDYMKKLEADLEYLKARLRDREIGDHVTASGVVVTIGEPARSFDQRAALELLSLEQQARCMAYDNTLIKEELTPRQLEQVMKPGKGKRRVTVRA